MELFKKSRRPFIYLVCCLTSRKLRINKDSIFRKLWEHEFTKLNFLPLDKENIGAGGRIEGMRTKWNFRTMTPSRRFVYGLYGEDFITFGVYEIEDPLENE